MSAARVVHVEIHGQRYAVRSDLDPSYVSQLAMYFDEKMRMASAEIQSADSLRIAVIAALNVADELFRARADGQGLEGRVLSRAADIERLVDAVLEDARIKSAGAIAANS
jgi:cell division protein ZapA